MKSFYKWLPIVFGCHCKKERSFHYHGKQFPICARCTGELIGILGAIFTYYFFHPSIIISVCFMLPLIVDGFLQRLTSYESNNWKRLITGILFGYALIVLFIMSTVYVYDCGRAYGMKVFYK